jgi:hypothetical protein
MRQNHNGLFKNNFMSLTRFELSSVEVRFIPKNNFLSLGIFFLFSSEISIQILRSQLSEYFDGLVRKQINRVYKIKPQLFDYK